MKPNKSQYSGTLKDSICTSCGQPVNNLNAQDQEKHLEECKKQTKLS